MIYIIFHLQILEKYRNRPNLIIITLGANPLHTQFLKIFFYRNGIYREYCFFLLLQISKKFFYVGLFYAY